MAGGLQSSVSDSPVIVIRITRRACAGDLDIVYTVRQDLQLNVREADWLIGSHRPINSKSDYRHAPVGLCSRLRSLTGLTGRD